MKKWIIVTLTSMVMYNANAQNKTTNSLTYKTAIGVKIWDGGGLSLKTFIEDKAAVEFIGFFNGNGSRITGLYELHGDLSTEGNLKWYIGPGAHVGFYKVNGKSVSVIGVDGVIGLDFKVKTMPLNISLDWQPTFEFRKDFGFSGGWGGLGIRYTL